MHVTRQQLAAPVLPLADERRKVLRQGDGLGHLGMLRAQLRELLRLCCGALRLVPEHEPGRPAWRQGLIGGFGDDRQRLSRAALPRRQALGLT
jgi:hypothetical protein